MGPLIEGYVRMVGRRLASVGSEDADGLFFSDGVSVQVPEKVIFSHC